MSMIGVKRVFVAVALSALVVGCANKGTGGSQQAKSGDTRTYAANTFGTGDRDAFDGRSLSSTQREMLAQRKFLFDFDRDVIKPEYYDNLTAHADYLRENPNKVIRIEGHTDEQGSREYNVGLGERRGKSVSNFLMSQGVSPRQIHVVSYGAEKPDVRFSSEDAYRQNRRALIVYEQ